METYFNVKIEFDKVRVHHTIENCLQEGEKGYVCVLESNNITVANTNATFLEVVNHSLVNICDGSNVAWLLGKIHKQPFRSYIGVDIFEHYLTTGNYRHYFIGNTQEVLDGLRQELSQINPEIGTMKFVELPFRNVEQFDYLSIAKSINADNPDLIWVSLGAPKQELFMSLLMPHLKRGILFGVGAAFNFKAKVGKVRRAPLWMRKLRLEWFYRAFEEPQKNIPRYWGFVKILPRLIAQELRNTNFE